MTTARELGALPDGPLDTAIYHCQQAAEKAVKGFLAFHDHRLERSHDVERLVGLAAGYEASFRNSCGAYPKKLRRTTQPLETAPASWPDFSPAHAWATAKTEVGCIRSLSNLPSGVCGLGESESRRAGSFPEPATSTSTCRAAASTG